MLVLMIALLPACGTLQILSGVFNLSGDISPEQQAKRLASIKDFMSAFDVLEIDNTKAPAWYAKQKKSLEKRRKKADAIWELLDTWAELPPEWVEYWEQANETADAVLVTLDAFILPEPE